ncbi:hypothetical protein [Lacrimispora indolis]|uniref:hypothetical protein n=1 Tax=Lacrimispora indolis TaxID=69825 RepID=UPI000405C358|nr:MULTISPECIES: hypothetical protein [Lachnospiraceae]MBE7720520.1 hypothetical protein [Lacrimispora celerecrescens]
MKKYLLKSGILYKREQETIGPALANIKNRLCGLERQIFVEEQQFLTGIQTDLKPTEHVKGACPKKYFLKNHNGEILMSGFPKYAKGQDPADTGWPVYRMPRIDSVDLLLQDHYGSLQMINSQNYLLSDTSGQGTLNVFHRGVIGGWNIEAPEEFSPEIICGIFVFCRYLEQENELIVV